MFLRWVNPAWVLVLIHARSVSAGLCSTKLCFLFKKEGLQPSLMSHIKLPLIGPSHCAVISTDIPVCVCLCFYRHRNQENAVKERKDEGEEGAVAQQ